VATIFDRLKKIIVDQLGVKKWPYPDLDTWGRFTDLELIMAIEEKFSTPNKKLKYRYQPKRSYCTRCRLHQEDGITDSSTTPAKYLTGSFFVRLYYVISLAEFLHISERKM
jgi:hypothetical protein